MLVTIFEIIKGIAVESVELFNKMSPYLLLGFFFAGLLHVFISVEQIARHLGKNSFGSVMKAVIFGIPLPLCSCGVIPAAVTLRRSGASKGSVISFLIATPITGVDSIFATYSLLGIFFAVYRVVASSIIAIIAGVIANLSFYRENIEDEQALSPKGEECPHCREAKEADSYRGVKKIRELFRYAFVQIISDIWKWLLLGVVIGGAISFVVPASIVERYLGSPWLSMLVMLAVGIPMYVCSTGSIPIAASLMLKGMNPGAALVFLLAGPATNAITITVVSKELGKKATLIYIGTIAVMSIVMGILLDFISGWFGLRNLLEHFHETMLPLWVSWGSTVVLLILIVVAFIREVGGKKPSD